MKRNWLETEHVPSLGMKVGTGATAEYLRRKEVKDLESQSVRCQALAIAFSEVWLASSEAQALRKNN